MAKFVITGASGAGKSTLLECLKPYGYDCRAEVGRQVVREQRAAGGTALPDRDTVAFRDLLFDRSIQSFDQKASSSGRPVLHDRSFLEAIAYSKIIGAPLPEHMIDELRERRFDNPVFVCAPGRKSLPMMKSAHTTLILLAAIMRRMWPSIRLTIMIWWRSRKCLLRNGRGL